MDQGGARRLFVYDLTIGKRCMISKTPLISAVMGVCLAFAAIAASQDVSRESREQKAAEPPAPPPDLVYVTVSVVDKNRNAVQGLERSHFRIWEDNTEQKIAWFAVESGSVSYGLYWGPSLPVGDFIPTLLRASGPGAEYFVVGNDTVLVPFNSDIKQAPRSLPHSEMDLMPSNGKDSVRIGLDVLTEAAAYPRRVMVVTTRLSRMNRVKDPIAGNSGNWGELMRSAMEQGMQVFTILAEGQATDNLGILESSGLRPNAGPNEAGNLTAGDQNIVRNADEEADYEALKKLATMTGGRTYQIVDPTLGGFAETGGLEELASEIGRGLRVQYRIGYSPTNKARDGKFRRLRVTVNPPEGTPKLEAWTKDGYYAPKPAPARK
jgi:Ca-activated chloride channel family protein